MISLVLCGVVKVSRLPLRSPSEAIGKSGIVAQTKLATVWTFSLMILTSAPALTALTTAAKDNSA